MTPNAEVVISLPFLKNIKERSNQVGVIVKTRAPDEKPDTQEGDPAIEACAQELIDAVHAKNAKAAAQAIQDAFEILKSRPEETDEGPEPHSYDAQNQKAAQD